MDRRNILVAVKSVKGITENLNVALKWAAVNGVLIDTWYVDDVKTLLELLKVCEVAENFSAIFLSIGSFVLASQKALELMNSIRRLNPKLPIVLIWPRLESTDKKEILAISMQKNVWRSVCTEVIDDDTGKVAGYLPWLEITLDYVKEREIFNDLLKEIALL